MLQEPGLAFQPAAEARETARRADHPMAWNDHGDGIGAVGRSDCAAGLGPSDPRRQRAVAEGFACRNG
eukprot:gene26039-32640_t